MCPPVARNQRREMQCGEDHSSLPARREAQRLASCKQKVEAAAGQLVPLAQGVDAPEPVQPGLRFEGRKITPINAFLHCKTQQFQPVGQARGADESRFAEPVAPGKMIEPPTAPGIESEYQQVTTGPDRLTGFAQQTAR